MSMAQARPRIGAEARGIHAVFLDCGDTLVDEATEVKNDLGETQTAELIPGADAMVQALVELGYRLALVADGPIKTFENVLGHYGLLNAFEARAISAQVGVEKPAVAMFETALTALGLGRADAGRVLMVGNNLERDIAGANALGLITVWLSWAPRRAKVPTCAQEVPDYEISAPCELLPLLAHIERCNAWK